MDFNPNQYKKILYWKNGLKKLTSHLKRKSKNVPRNI